MKRRAICLDGTAETEGWACARCTFQNGSSSVACQICGSGSAGPSAGEPAAIDLTADDDSEGKAVPSAHGKLVPKGASDTASGAPGTYAACACDSARAGRRSPPHCQSSFSEPLVSVLLAALCSQCQGFPDRTAMQETQSCKMRQTDEATVDVVAYETATAYPPADAHTDSAQPLCPFCPMSYMLPSTAAGARATQSAGTAKTAQLPAYLLAATARQQAAMRNGHICSTCQAARSQVGQVFHPRSGTVAVKFGDGKAIRLRGPCNAAVQQRVDGLADTCRLLFQNAKLALQMVNDDVRATAAGKAAGKRSSPAKKARTSSHHGRSTVWAAGTGFGGNESGYFGAGQATNTAALPTQHMQQQLQRQERDRPAALYLEAITDGLSEMAEVAEHARLPYAITAVLHAGPLPRLLHQLLDHASLQDICARHTLFAALFELLKTMGMHWDLLEVLSASRPAADDAASSSSAGSLLDLLRDTAQAAKMFNSFGNQLGEGSDADVESLGFSLHIAEVIEGLQGKAAIMQSMADAEAAEQKRLQDAGAVPMDIDEDDSVTTTSGRVASFFRSGRRRGKEQAGAAAEKAARAQAQAALEKRYVDTLQPLRYQAMDMLSRNQFYFRQQMPAPGSTDARNARKHIHQTQSLSRDLPVTWASSIFVVQDENRFSALKALIIGPQDTPYQNGAFIFDIWLPPEFPDAPPKVQLLTTGGGRIRFNPNLYNCGKVCLSLLGTWAGPSWQPGVSTLLQVLVSIQSMILVKDPWFNEPGRESHKDLSSSEQYNRQLQRDTLHHAVLPALMHPPAEFADVLRQHYSMKRAELTAQCEAWVHASSQPLPAGGHHHRHAAVMFGEFGSTGGEHVKTVADKVKAALAKLPAAA